MKVENNLDTDKVRGLVWRLAFPSMLAQFVNVMYSIVDRMYIGNIPEIGALALAGVGICGPVVTLISSFASWIGVGGAPLMSIRLGQDGIAGMILAVPIGLLFVNLYHYGAFKGITDSLAVLAGDIERFRRKEV